MHATDLGAEHERESEWGNRAKTQLFSYVLPSLLDPSYLIFRIALTHLTLLVPFVSTAQAPTPESSPLKTSSITSPNSASLL
jgi:hypothetical protein